MATFVLRDVLGDGAFAEVGRPVAAAVAGDAVVVTGRLPLDLQDSGHVPAPDHVLAVYDLATMECRRAVPTGFLLHTLAVHQSGRLVAAGGGGYDGGWAWTGSLVVLDVGSLDLTSLLATPREVRALRWLDDDSLEAVLMPQDEDSDPFATQTLRVPREAWDGAGAHSLDAARHVSATAEVDVDDDTLYEPPAPGRPVAELLDDLAAGRGLVRRERGPVRALLPLLGGDVLACGAGILAERWSSNAEAVWRRTAEGTGAQLLPLEDGRVLSVVETDRGDDRGSRVTVLYAVDGTELDVVAEGRRLTATGGGAGGALLRATDPVRDDEEDEDSYEDYEDESEEYDEDEQDEWHDGGSDQPQEPLPVVDLDEVDRVPATVLDGRGRVVGTVRLPDWTSQDDLRPARAARLLAVEGAAPWPWEARAPLSRVVEVHRGSGGPYLSAPLFDLDPQPERHAMPLENVDHPATGPSERSVSTGPAVELSDRLGEHHLLQSWCEDRVGAVHPDQPPPPGLLARRDRAGRVVWLVSLAERVAGLDVHAGTVAVAGELGTLTMLDAQTGAVTGTEPLLPVECCPTALCFATDGSLWVGLADGRVLRLREEVGADATPR